MREIIRCVWLLEVLTIMKMDDGVPTYVQVFTATTRGTPTPMREHRAIDHSIHFDPAYDNSAVVDITNKDVLATLVHDT